MRPCWLPGACSFRGTETLQKQGHNRGTVSRGCGLGLNVGHLGLEFGFVGVLGVGRLGWGPVNCEVVCCFQNPSKFVVPIKGLGRPVLAVVRQRPQLTVSLSNKGLKA